MQFTNPAFIIPNKNNNIDKKPGGGAFPDFFGRLEDFEDLKERRIQETENIINKLSSPNNILRDNITNNIYFEIKFHDDVKSKSSLPTEFLVSNHISLFGQKFNDNFLAVCSQANFISFYNQIKKIELRDPKNKHDYSKEGAYLSSIKEVTLSNSEDILHMKNGWEDNKTNNSYIYLSSALSKSESNIMLNKIKELDPESNAELLELTSNETVIYGNFTSDFLNEISKPDPKNPVQKIEQGIIFEVSKQQNIPFSSNEIAIKNLSLESKVAIFDSGVFENDFVKPFILGKINYSEDSEHLDTLGHGTFVASRVIYGDDLKDQVYAKELFGKNKILDVKIFDNSGKVSDITVLKALNDIVVKYPDIKVFNLSLNSTSNDEILKGSKNIITREIDSLAYKYKVIIIVSSGNHDTFSGCKYPDCLLEDSAVIAPPADTINGLSVGAIVKKVSTDSIAKNLKEISPFSRCGIDNLYKKPDLVHFGGNIDKYGSFDGIGEIGFSHEDSSKIAENVGTSFSAPLVSGIAGNIYAYLEKTNMVSNISDMTKALLIHSARYNIPLGSSLKESDLNKMVGFGVPDFNLAFDSSLHSAMFLYTGELKTFEDKGLDNENKHKIQFTIPEELKQPGKELKIRGTLVYTPKITSNGDKNYALSDIELNLHYLNSNGKLSGGNLTKGTVDYRIDWNPIKHFEKNIRSSSYTNGLWEIWLTLNLRGEIDSTDYIQPYALIISIEDISPDYSKRIEIGNIIKLNHPEYQTLEIREKIQV